MLRNELRIGDVIVAMNGEEYKVMGNIKDNRDIILVETGETSLAWADLDRFEEDLSAEVTDRFDKIVKGHTVSKVYRPIYTVDVLRTNIMDMEMIWERKAGKNMTVSEIEEVLGYKIKVVSENE